MAGLDSVLEGLVDKKALAFRKEPALDKQMVLRVTPETGEPEVDARLDTIWGGTLEAISERSRLVRPHGWTHNPQTQQLLKEAMQRAPKNAVVKLMMYHGRTWLAPQEGIHGYLIELARDRADLHFQILIVSADAAYEVREGSRADEHRAAATFGVGSIDRKYFEPSVRERIDIRTYGQATDEALLRCVIIERDHELCTCHITTWRFGIDRGLYGRELELAPESTLAILCREYFDSVFRKQRPQVRGYEQYRWFLQHFRYGLIVWLTLFSCAASAVLFPTTREVTVGIAATAIFGWILKAS